jgi:hypothetical protein
MTTLDTFELMESRYFGFRERKVEYYSLMAEKMRQILLSDPDYRARMKALRTHLAVLVRGDRQDPSYPSAFARFQKHCRQFSLFELCDYLLYLAEEFKLPHEDESEKNIDFESLPSLNYKTPSDIAQLLEQRKARQ